MNIFEIVVFELQYRYTLVKNWILKKLGIKTKMDELMENPIRTNWFLHHLSKKHDTNGKELSQEQVDKMLKDI